MLHVFFLAWLGVVAIQVSPGPNMIAVVEAALGQGRRAALFVVLGVASGVLTWSSLTALGLGALFNAAPAVLTGLKFVGGAYLLYVGIKALLAARRGGATNIAGERRMLTPFTAWRRGLVVIMTNPKAALFWSAMATFLLGSGASKIEALAFGPVAAVTAVVIYGMFALAFSTRAALGVYARFAQAIQAAFGALFGALGGTLILAGIKDVRP